MQPTDLRHSHLGDVVLWLIQQRRRFRVTGESMVPLLSPGEEVLLVPHAYRHQPPQAGDIVVAQHPTRADLRLIKWVAYVDEAGHCFLKGINTDASTDSRSFGLVSPQFLLGKVVCRFP